MRQIEIIVKPGGKVDIDVMGVEDATCHELTADLIAELGVEISVEDKPQEYSELDGTQIHVYEDE